MDADLAKAKTKVDKFAKDVESKTKAKAGKKDDSFGSGLIEGLGLPTTMAAIGAAASAAAVGGIAMLTKSAMEMADALADAADNMDMSVEQIQILQAQFGNAGLGAEKFAKVMSDLSLNVQKARDGDVGAQKALENLGLSYEDLFALSPAEQLAKISDAAQELGDKQKVAANLSEVFGKNARLMVGPLMQGGDAMRKFGEDFTVATEDNVKRVGDLADATASFWTEIKAGTINAIGAIIKYGDEHSKVMKGMKDAAVSSLDAFSGGIITVSKLLGVDKAIKGIVAPKASITEDPEAKKKREIDAAAALQSQADEEALSAGMEMWDLLTVISDERKQVAEIEAATVKIAEAAIFSRLSDEEKINSLTRDREELEARATQDTIDGANARQDQLEIEVKIGDLQARIADKQAAALARQRQEQERINAENDNAMQAHHELGMKAQEEMMKRQEDAADKQLSRHEQEKQKLAEIAHMKEQMVGQDIDQQNIMRNEMLKTKEAEIGKIKARLAMSPEERRQADRNDRKDDALDRKAKRIFEGKQREAERKLQREAKLGDRNVLPKQAAPAAPKAGDPADTMKRASDGFIQAVDDLRKLRVVAILNT
jgi:hypothetical protein